MSRLTPSRFGTCRPRRRNFWRTSTAVVVLSLVLAAGALAVFAQPSAAEVAGQPAPVIAPPSAPDKNRVRVHITAGGPLEFAIGAQSLRVGPGQVVRYVLFAQSPGGPENISFEAIDCASGSWQLSAVWNAAKQSWIANPDPSWQRIRANGATRIHATLQGDFCSLGMVHGDAAAIVRRVAEGLRAEPNVRSNPYSF